VNKPSSTSEKSSLFSNYLSIARFGHWGKNVLMLPGAALAYIVDTQVGLTSIASLAFGLLSTCFIASANYTINEYLDGKTDYFHPIKALRPAAQGVLDLKLVLIQYLLFAALGVMLASFLNPVFMYAVLLLLLMGLVYNVRPVRSKDFAFVDVLTEAINNPIRLVLGWSAVSTILLPPSSLLISYWMGGAYLMAIKRFAEYRMIRDADVAKAYRKSFKNYTENSLWLSAFFYALASVFFLGIFLIKYKIEFIISFPFIALLFVWYNAIALEPEDSVAINPEKLYRRPAFLLYAIFLGLLILTLFFIDIPTIHYLMDHSVINDVRLER